jgi:F0F1-type ATP synthase membrane subunit c/vacuolar-type H+-ATPase subunit K
VVEVEARYGNFQPQRVKLGPNQDNYVFRFDIDIAPEPPPIRPDLIDACIVFFLAAAIDIFLLAMATQFINSPVFQTLPSFITDTYTAVWTSLGVAGAGIGSAIIKAFTRDPNARRPNYVLYVLFTALALIVVIVLLAFLALAMGRLTKT